MLEDNYIGWGRAYPDFQGMQILTGSLSLLTTIEYHYVLMWLIPLVSSLAIPMLFIIGKEITIRIIFETKFVSIIINGCMQCNWWQCWAAW